MSRNYNQRYGGNPRERTTMQFVQKTAAIPFDATVTMAYVPVQTDTAVYDEMKALEEGTLFQSLNKPFCKAGECK